jgi:methyl-accepting chemotaxis protein
MKLSIKIKLLTMMLILTLIPLATLGYLAVKDANELGLNAVDDSINMGNLITQESLNALNELGENIIKQKAIDVAKQLEIYIRQNPTMTVEDLQNDEYFKELAVQPVGDTGYTAVTDVESLICRFHASERIVNLALENLAGPLPGFWSVMSKSQSGIEVYGYYDWVEPDESIKQKYMFIAIVDAQTADDVIFSVAATTYIDEFSQPAKEIEQKIGVAIKATESIIKAKTESLGTQNTVLMITIITMVIVVILGLIFANSITRPLKNMTDAGNKIADGDLNAEIPTVKTNDEIEDLGLTMNMLVGAIKFLRKNKEKEE